MNRIYLILAGVGLIVPYYFLVTFLLEHGLDLPLLLEQLFATPISTFFAVDLLITGVVFLLYSHSEAGRIGLQKWWIYPLATVLVGPSFAMPLFLYFREGLNHPART
jgi:hypothetical protein